MSVPAQPQPCLPANVAGSGCSCGHPSHRGVLAPAETLQKKFPSLGRMISQGSEGSQLPHLFLAPKPFPYATVQCSLPGQDVWGRQIAQPEPLPSCGAEPVGWVRPYMPLAPLVEVTLDLRSTPIRITTIPSSVSSICNISSVSSNVTKVSAQGVCGAVSHLAIAWQLQGLGVGSRDQGISVGSMLQRLCLVLVGAFVLIGFFSSRDPGLCVWLHSPK